MHRAQGRDGTSRAGGEPRAAPPSPGIPPKRAKVTAEPVAPEEGPARPAAPFFARKLKNAAIGTGCDIRLRVVAVGNPRPSLRWYRNEELLTPHEEEYGTLWIRDSKKEDAGVYTCIAENERGEAMTSAVLAIIDMEGKGSVAAGVAVLAQPWARVCQGWQWSFTGSCRSACMGPARAGFAVSTLLQAGVPGAGSTGAALWLGVSMWLQHPLPGQAGCQGWARRCREHVMPSLLGAGGEREREMQLRCRAPVVPPSAATDMVPPTNWCHCKSHPRAPAAHGQSCLWHHHHSCTRHWGCTGRAGTLQPWGWGEEPNAAGGRAVKWVEPMPCRGHGLMVNWQSSRQLLVAP